MAFSLSKSNKWLLGIAVFVLSFLLFLPVIVKQLAIAQLNNRGLAVAIDNVDINLFTGEFSVDGITEIGKNTPDNIYLKRFYIEWDWWPLLDHQVQINQLVLDSLSSNINNKNGQLRIASIAVPSNNKKPPVATKNTSTAPWFVDVKAVTLNNIKLHYQDDKVSLPLQLSHLTLDALSTKKVTNISKLNLVFKLNNSNVALDVAGDMINPNGKIKTKLTIQQFSFLPFTNWLPKGVKLSKGSTETTSFIDIQLKNAKPLRLDYRGDWSVNNVDMMLDGNKLTNQKLTWSGKNSIVFKNNGDIKINSQGSLSSKALQITQAKSFTTLVLNAFNFNGQVTLNNKTMLNSIMVDAAVNLKSFKLNSADKNNSINFKALKLAGIKAKGVNNLKVGELLLNNVVLSNKQSPQALYKSEQLIINNIALLNRHQLTVDSLTQTDQYAYLYKYSNKKYNVYKFLYSFFNVKSNKELESTEETSRTKTVFKFNIKQVLLTGDNQFNYKDESLTPVFKKSIQLDRLTLNNVNNSDAKQVIDYLAKGKILPNSPYKIVGNIKPFAKKLSLEAKVKTEGIGLVEYSSFILPVTGYQIESGEVDTDLDIQIKDNIVDAKNKIIIHQLTLTESDPKTAKKLNNTISMSMDKALDLLRDDNNTIKLNIPLKGPLDNLSVNPNDTINLALGNALKTGSQVYIATALFPYGTLYTLVKIAGEKINAIKLKPVIYPAGGNSLSTKDKDYLAKVARILQNKKQLSVRLCVKATSSDKTKLIELQKDKKQTVNWDEKLIQLADSRKNKIENYLNKQFKIKPNRIIDCRTVIENKKEAKPRVDLLL